MPNYESLMGAFWKLETIALLTATDTQKTINVKKKLKVIINDFIFL